MIERNIRSLKDLASRRNGTFTLASIYADVIQDDTSDPGQRNLVFSSLEDVYSEFEGILRIFNMYCVKLRYIYKEIFAL